MPPGAKIGKEGCTGWAAGMTPKQIEVVYEHKVPVFAAALGSPVKPVAAVVGGAKVSSKLDVLTNLMTKVDHLIIGGGMANTFLAARGVDVGKSLCEHDLAETAEEIMDAAGAAGWRIHLPYDVVVAKEFGQSVIGQHLQCA